MNDLREKIWPALKVYLDKYSSTTFLKVGKTLKQRCIVYSNNELGIDVGFRENNAGRNEDKRIQVTITFHEKNYGLFDYLYAYKKESLQAENILFSLKKQKSGHKILYINSSVENFNEVENLENIFRWLIDTSKCFYERIYDEISTYNSGKTTRQMIKKSELPRIIETSTKKTYARGKNAIEDRLINAGYKCEIATLAIEAYKEKNNGIIADKKKHSILKLHETFRKETDGMPYMEVHHLIPLHHQGRFDDSIDVYENMICLCPTCHRKLHFMELEERKRLLTFIYKKRNLKSELSLRGLSELTLEKFLNLSCE